MGVRIKKNGLLSGGRGIFISVVLILLSGFAVYLNSLEGEFLWDDIHFIKNNVYLRNWSHLQEIFTRDVAAGSGMRYNYYRPLTVFTYLVDQTLWGFDIRGYHLSSIFFHLLVAISVFFLGDLLFRDRLLGFLAGLLYAVHPLQTETVAYISGRPDSLAALFMIVCFILYLKRIREGKAYLEVLLVLSYLAALLSRENSIVLPMLLLLYHSAFKIKVKWRPFLAVAFMTLIYVFLRAVLLDPMAVPTTLIQRIPGFFVAVAAYFRLLLFPFHLHQEYGMRLFHFSQPIAIAGMWLAGSLIICGLIGLFKGRIIFFGIFWFFIALIPVCGVYPIKAYMAEHWLYVPSIGFFLLFASGLARLCRKKSFGKGTVFCLAGLLLFYGGLTVKQNNYFKDPVTFYERTLEYNPQSARLCNNLGIKYFSRGDTEAGLELFKRATEIDPGYPDAYNNLGHVYYTLGRYEEALALFGKAIEINPGYSAAYNNLGVLYSNTGKGEEGAACFKKASELNPYDADVLFNLGLVQSRLGFDRRAIGCLERALEIDPTSARAHYWLSRIYAREERLDLAEKHSRLARELGASPAPE
jgi:Flp pilus assembly protein TadD